MTVKTQGTSVSIETALAATKTITAITKANPAVVSSTGHGYTNGDIVKITGVVGMVELNDRAFVVAASATDSFSLSGVDSTNYTTYVSGGAAAKVTVTPVGKVEGIPTLFAGQAQTINTTHLKSLRQETIQGLAVAGTITMTLQLEDADAGQAAMQASNEQQAEKVYTITRSDSKVACCVAFCDSFSIAAAANDVYRVNASLTLKAARTAFA